MARNFYSEDAPGGHAIQYVETQPAEFTLITDQAELKRLYIGVYRQRESDGSDYFEDFRANLMMNILDGTYTPTQAFELEHHLKGLQSELLSGSWLTAQSTSLNLPLLGIYDQTMKDDIQAYLDTYVSENY